MSENLSPLSDQFRTLSPVDASWRLRELIRAQLNVEHSDEDALRRTQRFDQDAAFCVASGALSPNIGNWSQSLGITLVDFANHGWRAAIVAVAKALPIENQAWTAAKADLFRPLGRQLKIRLGRSQYPMQPLQLAATQALWETGWANEHSLINEIDEPGLLFWAARQGWSEMCLWLGEIGADLEKTELLSFCASNSAVEVARAFGHEKCAQTIIAWQERRELAAAVDEAQPQTNSLEAAHKEDFELGRARTQAARL